LAPALDFAIGEICSAHKYSIALVAQSVTGHAFRPEEAAIDLSQSVLPQLCVYLQDIPDNPSCDAANLHRFKVVGGVNNKLFVGLAATEKIIHRASSQGGYWARKTRARAIAQVLGYS
jgi:hypothetical protein